MTFTTKEKQLINRELKRKASLETKSFVKIGKRKGRHVEIFRNKRTGKLEAMPTSLERLKFKLKVAKSR